MRKGISKIVLITILFAGQGFAQNEETVKGCIAGNVTMKFKPNIGEGVVKTYIWNKNRGVYMDPSFAKFEPSVSPDLEIYFNEKSQVQGRIFHDLREPTTLHLTDLRKTDQEKYTLVISFDPHKPIPTMYVINLQVQDVCFDEPKNAENCTVTTCYTGANGRLKTPWNSEEAVNGYKLVKVCNESKAGNYSCCNAAGTCLQQDLQGLTGSSPDPIHRDTTTQTAKTNCNVIKVITDSKLAVTEKVVRRKKIRPDEFKEMQYTVMAEQRKMLRQETLFYKLMNKKLRRELNLPAE